MLDTMIQDEKINLKEDKDIEMTEHKEIKDNNLINDSTTDSSSDTYDINDPFENELKRLPLWIIHPHSKGKIFWDVSLMIFIIYTCIEIPFTLGFDVEFEAESFVAIFGFFIDIALMVDVGVTFRTAIYDKYDPLYLIVDSKEIARNYIKGWFLVEFLTSIPLDFILTGLGFIRLIRTVKIVKLIKLLRALRVLNSINTLKHNLKLVGRTSVKIFRLTRIVFDMMLCAHYIGCLWYFVGNESEKIGQPNWLENRGIIDATLGVKYSSSLYWAIVTLFTTGFGDIHAINTAEECVSMFIIVVGTIFFAYFIGAIGMLIANDNLIENEKLRRMEKAAAFCASKRLSSVLTKAIVFHTENYFETTYAFGDERELLNILPVRIKYEIGYQISKEYLSATDIFDDFDEYIKGLISLKLKTISCNVNIKLFQRGHYGKELFIQRSGIAIESDKNGNTYILRRGDICGWESYNKEQRQTSIKCLSWCEYFSLNWDDVKNILKEYFPHNWENKWMLIKNRIENANITSKRKTEYVLTGNDHKKYYELYKSDFDEISLKRDQGIISNFEKMLNKPGNEKYLEKQIKSLAQETQNNIYVPETKRFTRYSGTEGHQRLNSGMYTV